MKSPAPALAALAALLGCQSNEPEIDVDKQLELYMTTATYLYQDESLVRAQDQAVKALELDPDNEPMRRMVGWIRLRMGKTEDLVIAKEFFEGLIADGDEEAPVLLGLATAQERLGVANYEASLAISSGEQYTEHPDPAGRAAELAAQARDYWEKSHANYEKVLAGPTSQIKALNGLQRVSALLGDYEESLDWNRALLDASSAELEGWRATLRSNQLTETEETTAMESEAMAIDRQVECHLFGATILRRLGRLPAALEQLDLAIALNPVQPEVYSLRAQLRSDLGLHAGAIEDIDRYLRSSTHPFEHPDIKQAYELRSFCERQVAAAGG